MPNNMRNNQGRVHKSGFHRQVDLQSGLPINVLIRPTFACMGVGAVNWPCVTERAILKQITHIGAIDFQLIE